MDIARQMTMDNQEELRIRFSHLTDHQTQLPLELEMQASAHESQGFIKKLQSARQAGMEAGQRILALAQSLQDEPTATPIQASSPTGKRRQRLMESKKNNY